MLSAGYYMYDNKIFNDDKGIVFEMKRIYDGDVETADKETVEFISVYKTTALPNSKVGGHPYRWIHDFDTKNMWSAVLTYDQMIPLVAV